MKDITKTDIDTLVKLQEAETEIVRIQDVLKKIEKEKELKGAKLKQFEQGYEENKTEYETVSSLSEDLETEIQLIEERIKKSNETLRFVKTNKEYQVLQREVDDNIKRKDRLEIELIEILDDKEAKEKNLEEFEKELNMLRDQVLSEQKEIEEKSADDREQLQEYLDNRDRIGQDLDPGLLKQFQKISKMNQGLAVVQVKNEVCMGCFLNVPPQLFIEVQRFNSLILCPQCSRILCYTE